MTRDELVEELLPITRDFINQKRLSDAGCRTMLRFLLTKIELSKLHQPTVISAVCDNIWCEDGKVNVYGNDWQDCPKCRDKQTEL